MNSVTEMSILVTGANGFLGSAIIDELKRLKARTVSIIWPPTSCTNSENNTIAVDLCDTNSYAKMSKFGPFDAVVHCAALLPGRTSDKNLLVSNQVMLYKLLEWAKENSVGYFSFASTCRVYGLQDYPCIETSPLIPPDIYTISKISCEYLIKTLLANCSIPYSIMRIAAPYGPGAKNENVIRRFLMNSAQNMPITLLGSGSRSQDFVYQIDVARAFCLAIQSQSNGIYNLASGSSISMFELAEMALTIFQRDIKTNILYSGIDNQENYRGNFPINSAFNSFGYHPQTLMQNGLWYTAEAWGLI